MMKLWITEPHGVASPLQDALKARWTRLAPNTCIEFVTAKRGEIHGELLTRIWALILADKEFSQHLISEADFLLEDATSIVMYEALLDCRKAIFVPNCVRHPDTLELKPLFPITAPWLLGFNKELLDLYQLPFDFLAAGGPCNDAANLAFFNSMEVMFDGNFYIIPAKDARKHGILGISYPGIGYHCFWNREYLSSPDKILMGDWTVGRHLKGVRKLLET